MVSHRIKNILLDLKSVQRSAEDSIKIASDLSTAVVTIIATTIQEQLGNLSEEDLIHECRKRIFRLRRDVSGRL